jgi:hypothetical protein
MLGRTKSRIAFFVIVACCAVMLTNLQNDAFGQPRNQTTGPAQILVLKNGEILRGQIEQNALQLIIHTVQGSRLVIPKTKADFVCKSLDEAFWQKSARTKASDNTAQVALFRWCLKHRLLDHAENQFNILLNCDITATELASLNRQLASMLTTQQQLLAQELANAEAELKQDKLRGNEIPNTVVQAVPFQPLPGWESPGPKSPELKNNASANAPNRGMVRQASFQQSPRQSTAGKPRTGLSSIGAIPELKNRSQFEDRQVKTVDPFDPAVFNAETLRRQEAASKN